VVLALACNKMDLAAERRVVTQQQAAAAAAAIGCSLYETSAVRPFTARFTTAFPQRFPLQVSNEGVDLMFYTLACSMAQQAEVRVFVTCWFAG